MEDVDLKPITGDPITQNRKLVALLRETIAKLDDLSLEVWTVEDAPKVREVANWLEAEVSIVVT